MSNVSKVQAMGLRSGDVIVTQPRLVVDRVIAGTPKVRVEAHFVDSDVEVVLNYGRKENVGVER